MNRNENINSISDIVTRIVDNYCVTGINPNDVMSVWKKVVSNIGKNDSSENNEISLGEKIAANSHVVDLKNGVLLVEANHSGWIQYLKMYKNFIIKGIKWSLPDVKINSLAFRVAGSKANLSEQYDDLVRNEKLKMAAKVEAEEKKLQSSKKLNSQKTENKLPPELSSRFENLMKQMKNDENN